MHIDLKNYAAAPEPRWPAIIAMLAVGGLYAALPSSLSLAPGWVLFCVVAALQCVAAITHHAGLTKWNQIVGMIISGVITVAMVVSLTLLIRALPHNAEPSLALPPIVLLRSAGALWLTNVIVFAVWYWRLDAGGPNQRDLRGDHTSGAFLFPQMTLSDADRATLHCGGWSPGFVDYLFLAFNTSTALSPTDSPVFSRWAKVLMMLQSLISLSVLALLAARGVNIL